MGLLLVLKLLVRLMTVKKTFNSGQWTAARFHSFIKGGLRGVSGRWPPKHLIKKNAWVERGVYLCAGHGRNCHKVPVTIKVAGRRENNIFIDHIEPVIDPKIGFVSWDVLIERMFVEIGGLQLLCKDCHSRKTADERPIRKMYNEKSNKT